MILIKVVLDNFRAHKHFEFIPELSGVTAISGENGAGKSTILDAFAWSLFGTKASGIKNKNYIREGVDPKEDKVRVTSYIIVGNREYKIERSIVSASGSTNCKVYSKEINSKDDYVLDCGPGVSHSEKFIRNTLGIDEKGFLTSTFIQQKQVDQIISAGPRDRGAVIEQLIGVSSISTGVDIAKAESRGLQSALSVIQPGSLEDEKTRVQQQKKLYNELLAKRDETNTAYLDLIEKHSKLEKEYNKEKIAQEEVVGLRQTILIKENDLKNINDRIVSHIELFKNIKTDNSFSQEFYDSLVKEVEDITREINELNGELINLKAQNSKYEELFSKKVPASAEEKLIQEEEKKKVYEETRNKLIQTILYTEKQIEDNTVFIENLNDGSAECPVCKTPIVNIKEELENHKKDLEKSKVILQESRVKLKDTEEQLNKTTNLLIKINNALEVKKEQENSKDDYQNIKLKIKEIEKSIERKEIQISTTKKEIEGLNIIRANKEQFLKAKEELNHLQTSAETIQNELSGLENELKNANVLHVKDYKKLESKYIATEKMRVSLELDLNNQNNRLLLEKEKGQRYVEIYKECKKATEEYQRVSNQLNILNSSIDSLSKFKNARAKSSIPKLTTIASELLHKFTNGHFTEVRLSEKYEASVVTSSGSVRAVSLLSGGELSTVAIALRLAISIFINGDGDNLLILDEVIVSMSEERSEQILETISSLSKSQIIFIAHSPVINNFADKIIEL